MKAEFQHHHINYQNNQLMKWCLSNLMVERDNQGNYDTKKNRSDNLRDDAACALMDAMVAYYLTVDKYTHMIR